MWWAWVIDAFSCCSSWSQGWTRWVRCFLKVHKGSVFLIIQSTLFQNHLTAVVSFNAFMNWLNATKSSNPVTPSDHPVGVNRKLTRQNFVVQRIFWIATWNWKQRMKATSPLIRAGRPHTESHPLRHSHHRQPHFYPLLYRILTSPPISNELFINKMWLRSHVSIEKSRCPPNKICSPIRPHVVVHRNMVGRKWTHGTQYYQLNQPYVRLATSTIPNGCSSHLDGGSWTSGYLWALAEMDCDACLCGWVQYKSSIFVVSTFNFSIYFLWHDQRVKSERADCEKSLRRVKRFQGLLPRR